MKTYYRVTTFIEEVLNREVEYDILAESEEQATQLALEMLDEDYKVCNIVLIADDFSYKETGHIHTRNSDCEY